MKVPVVGYTIAQSLTHAHRKHFQTSCAECSAVVWYPEKLPAELEKLPPAEFVYLCRDCAAKLFPEISAVAAERRKNQILGN